MHSSQRPEDTSPLLCLFVDEDGQKTERSVLINKNRYNGITTGATAIITQWPGHLASCWLTTLLVSLTTICFSMMFFAATFHTRVDLLAARCRTDVAGKETGITVLLVHGPTPWSPNQLQLLDQISDQYNQYTIELIIIETYFNFREREAAKPAKKLVKRSVTTENETTTPNKKRKRPKSLKKRLIKAGQNNTNIDANKIIVMLLNGKYNPEKPIVLQNLTQNKWDVPKPQNITGVLKKHPQIKLMHTTYEKIFKNSPLYYSWQHLNEMTRLFAIRVLHLWNSAGISFDLLHSENASLFLQESRSKLIVSDQLTYVLPTQASEELVQNIGTVFETLAEGVVVMDDEGFNMKTKTTCHSFFGDLLRYIKTARRETTVHELINKTLSWYCNKGEVESGLCRNV